MHKLAPLWQPNNSMEKLVGPDIGLSTDKITEESIEAFVYIEEYIFRAPVF